jgi:hypothetical protein
MINKNCKFKEELVKYSNQLVPLFVKINRSITQYNKKFTKNILN